MDKPNESRSTEENKDVNLSAPPKTIGVYDRPEEKKIPSTLIITIVSIILLSLLAFWLIPTLF